MSQNGTIEHDDQNEGFDQFIQDQEQQDEQENQVEETQTLTVKKLASVLDNLPENRAERLVILLNNLPSEDLCHIINDKIPPFLRIDKDVQEQRDKLRNFAKEFMDFNIDDLDIEIRQKLKELV